MDAFKDSLSQLVSTFNRRKLTDKVHPHNSSHGAAPYPDSHLAVGPSKGGKKRTRRVKSKKSKSKSRKSKKSKSKSKSRKSKSKSRKSKSRSRRH